MIRLSRRGALLGAATVLAAPAVRAQTPRAIRVTYVSSPFNVPAFVMKQRRMLETAFAPDGIAVEQPEITSGARPQWSWARANMGAKYSASGGWLDTPCATMIWWASSTTRGGRRNACFGS